MSHVIFRTCGPAEPPANVKFVVDTSVANKVENAIVVIGAGLTGMSVAMMLARHGLPVTVIERDECAAFGRREGYPALRAGAAHARRPHQLMAGARDILRRSLPDVTHKVYELGARDAVEHPGESPAAFMALRRALLERALLTCARDLPTLTLRFGERVLDVVTADEPGARVRGVRTTKAALPARLVIDATGVHARLAPAAPYVSMRSHLYYTSQPFRLTDEGFAAAQDAVALWSPAPSRDVVHVRLFVHDPPFASVLVALRGDRHPPAREVMLESYRAALASERLRSCLRDAVPLAPIQDFGFLKSRIRLFTFPGPCGLHQIGDALAALNPLTSRGAGLGLVQAELLAEAIARDPGDFAGQRAVMMRAYHDWVAPHWAMGVVQGFLRPDAEPPPEVAELIAAARRRWNRIREIRRAWHAPSADSTDRTRLKDHMRTALEVLALQAPPSVLDSLPELAER
ncbi:FAD-dependent oxidoreductase [Nonomuraea sp. NPDC050451]|uniref:FAD-dependent oxidoreductase n=1 Tax=Nonomuraea sp. NPDC050451 TaxID=3364364 RepID=UPI0037AE1C0C